MMYFDGAPAFRTRSNGTSIGVADMDATQEVQILTSNYAAEFGGTSGGQIRIVTRGGEKRLHGSIYEYFRNPVLNANDWGRKANPAPGVCGGATQPVPQQCRPNQFRYNQFGYRVSGPVIIPGTKFNAERKKLFWAFSQEWVKLRQESLRQIRVPTLAMRNGDFSELALPNNIVSASPIFIRDPQKTGTCNATSQVACFSDGGVVNKIPVGRLSPQGMALLRTFPVPTGLISGNNNWQDVRPNPNNQSKSTLVVDYHINDNQTIHGSGQIFRFKDNTPFPFGGQTTGDPGLAPRIFNRPNQWLSITHVWTISPRWVNEALATGSRDQVTIDLPGNTDIYKRSKYGITYPYVFTAPKLIPDKIPSATIDSFGSLDGGPYPSKSAGPIYLYSDNMTHVMGNHTIKFGALFRRSGENDFDQINVSGTPGGTNNMNGGFIFKNGTGCNSTVPSCGAGTASTSQAISNLAIGLFDTYAEIGARSYTPYRNHMWEFFGQDSWKVSEKLRVEYGMRYSIISPFWSLWRNMVVFDPATYDPSHVATVDPTTGFISAGDLKAQYNGLVIPGSGWTDAAKQNCRVAIACTGQYDFLFRGFPKQYSDVHYTEFQPRIGVAYDLGGHKGVLRAGVGRYVDPPFVSDSVFLGGNPPLQPTTSISGGSVDNPGGKPGNVFTQQVTSQAKDFPLAESWQWNGTYEREVGFSTVVTVAYAGRRGLHLPREANINQLKPGTVQANPTVKVDALRPYKGFNIIRVTDNVSNSIYHGLQVEANHRMSKGLAFGVAYTFSRSHDALSGQRDVVPNALDPQMDRTLWGVSDFDRTHLLNFSAIYQLPFFRAQQGLLGKIAGGWQLSEVSQWRTGTPFSITTGDDFAGVGPGSGNQYWLVAAGAKINPIFNGPTTPDAAKQYLPLSFFSKPTAGTFAPAGLRNIFRNPREQNHNLALFKDVAIGERQKVQFRAEAFNWLNHPNWCSLTSTGNCPSVVNPNSSSTFGWITQKVNNGRQVQLALRYLF